LDPAHPQRRLGQILESSGVGWCLVTEELVPLARDAVEQLGSESLPRLMELGELLAERSPAGSGPRAVAPLPPMSSLASSEALAYCLFTSGSTGVPKGVMVHQAGFLNHLWMMVEIFGLGPEDVVAQNASQCFDISVWQLTAALLVGGVVHIVDDAVAGDPTELLAEVEARAITVLELVPSLLAAVMDEIEAREQDPRRTPPALHRLRWIIPTGEALPPALARRWLRRYPGIPMVNAYGPAECSDDVSVEFLRRPGDAERAVVAVGRPLRNLALHLLDPQGRPVPVGVVGEIHVGGIGVGRGYLRDPRRTAEVFVPHALGGPAGGRLYASGDLGRFQPDGRIDFLGRRDHQVKVRGFRIEVGEVEAALDEHPQVERALVMVHRGRERAVAQLVAYAEVPAAVLPAAEEGVAAAPDGFDLRAWADELRDFLGERLPKYMVPSLFVPLAAFPLNANGKIDVAALPAPEEGAGARVLTAPRSRTERAVAEIWQQVLGIREVGVEDDFFDLGGHSLLATRVLSRLRAALGVDLALRDLFEATDLGSLAKKLDQQLGEASPFAVEPIEPLPPTAPAELSFAQERLWFLAQLDPTSAAYNLPAAIRLTGAVDHRLWHRVFQEILQRHQALRTTFRQVEGKPRQVVHQGLGLSLPVVDLEGLDTPVADREIHRLAVADAQCPFDLMVPPLLRCALLRQDRERHVLLLNMHHIVSDAWSMALLLQELAVLSEAFAAGEASPLPALPVQYPDFAHWQRRLLRGQHLECQLEFWRGQLQGAPPALDLPRRSSGTGDGFGDRGATRRFHLPAELSEELRVLSRRTGSTLFMTLLAAFATLLHRYSGASDLNVGVPVAGRPRAEMEGLIGFFVNTLVLRLGIGREATVRELLADVRGRSLDAFAHEDLPFERLVAELNPERDLTRSPLFQVMFALQTAPVAQVEVPGLVLERLDIDSGTTRFELFLELTEAGDVIEGAAHFSLELFDPAFMMRFLGHFRTLLEGFASAPEGAVGNLPLLAQSERHQVLREWNDSAAAVPLDRPFPQLFRSAAERWPQRRAAAVGDRSLTYAELFQRSSVLARRLEGRGVGPGTVLPLLAERSLELLTAVLAVLHTGAVYLPLDPRHPAPRLAQVLEESGCTTVVCAAELLPLLQEAGEILDPAPRAVKLEELLDTAEAAETPRGGAAPAGGAEHLAYVIYTSGSTGRPKGAMVTQRGMVNHLHAKIRDLGLTGDDVVAQTASQCFDISVWQMLAALMVGGRVEIYPDEVAHDPAVLVQRVDADDVTILETVPSLMRLLLDELGRRAERPELRALRWLVPTGEALPPELCSRWYEAYPAIRLLNAYGPTECSDDVSHYPVPAGEGAVVKTISIGRPVLNTQLYVVDRLFRPVPPGVVGELWVGGQGVGGGYLHDPQRTAEVFVPDAFSGAAAGRLYRTGDLVRHLPDGRLSFLGRVDHQVKIRGHRLELGEVEAQLQRHPALEAAVVAAQKETSGALQLVAYVLYGDVGEVPVEELRGFLQERLPTYAVPTAWTVLEELPLTPNGKVNRRALPRVSAEGQAGDRPYTAPRDETEEALAEIFAGLIGIQRVGVFDDFFDLGGHSLLATQALSRIRETFAIDLELRRLFEAPTVAELAGVVEDRIIEQIESLSDEEVDSLLEEDEPAPLAPAPTEDLVESLPERSG
ncbi:MAG: amino acid adenylation domain-containing protein, partial [Acidobacteriota bacterium]|nr:amino acid adenylation domain-containing protein [Acidobacteriota bacterium]